MKARLDARGRKTHTAPGTRYADLFDFAPITLLLVDSSGVVSRINKAACELLSIKSRHAVGRPLVSFAVDADRAELLQHLGRCRSGSGQVESEVRFLRQGDVPLTCRVSTRRSSLGGRRVYPTWILGQTEPPALADIRLSAEPLRKEAGQHRGGARGEARGAKDQFLATVSHELRTPLTPALLAANRLVSWSELPEEARRLAVIVRQNIEFEARLIDDLLDVARVNRDRLSLDRAPADVHEIVGDSVRACASIAAERNVSVNMHLNAESHHVSADRARLQQVFWNLLHNALKFTGPGGCVTVHSVNEGDASIRVTVRDTGVGMDDGMLERLFRPFDPERTLQDARAGLGLGLAISKGIVAAHGGQIWGTSSGVGNGSTFGVEFDTLPITTPVSIDMELQTTIPAASQSPLSLRVLLIEDDEDSRSVLEMYLEYHGHTVETAQSLEEGLARMEQSWDVIITDIGLKDGSGLEVARAARRLAHQPRRVIAFSGYGFPDDIKASLDAGFDEHLVKPIPFDRLLSSLHS